MFEKIDDLIFDSKKINFRGEKISKLEANILIFNLKLGLMDADLNEEEKKSYTTWKNGIECLKTLIKKPNAKISEKDYLIWKLNYEKKLINLSEKIKYCENHGHVPDSEQIGSGQGGTKVYGICKRCGAGYTRGLNPGEWKEFNEMMNTPFTK